MEIDMNNSDDPSNDPVINKVKEINKGYQNSEYSKQTPMQVGPGEVYVVSFMGQDKQWYSNYVFERGSERRAYPTFDKLISDPKNRINVPWWTEFETIRLFIISGLTILLAAAAIYIKIHSDLNQDIQFLTGLLGLLIGWLVGKNPASVSIHGKG
jgi:hypothetical protein